MISRGHPLFRRIRELRRDAAARAAEGVFLAEGLHLAAEALRADAPIEVALVAPRLAATAEGRDLASRLAARGVACYEAPDPILDALQDARSPQPVLLVVRRPAPVTVEAIARREGPPALIAVCSGIQDPGNLGGIVRTADAAGATGAIVTPGCADLFHPRTVRATAGSILRLPVVASPAAEALDVLRAAGVATIAAVPRGGVPYDAVDWTRPSAVVFGGEGGGLPDDLVVRAAASAHVPMAGGVESLSVGAAAAVILFAAARARR